MRENRVSMLAGHPRGFYVIVLTEVWERFSFYGMRALLVFYMVRHFQLTESEAVGVYASYASLLYLTPIIGGYVADRILGLRTAVISGALLMTAGHFAMAFEGSGGAIVGGKLVRDAAGEAVVYLALSLIAVGNGLFKPSLSSLLGLLYDKSDSRRDAGFTLFFIGVNVGTAAAALVCGYLGEVYGWRYGFGAAGVGMLSGLAIFWLRGPADHRVQNLSRDVPATHRITAVVLVIAALAASWHLIQSRQLVGLLLAAGCVVTFAVLIWAAVTRLNADERTRVFTLLSFAVVSVIYWALEDQSATSINLLTHHFVERDVLGITVHASQYLALAPLFVIALGPAVSSWWQRIDSRGRPAGTAAKFAVGMALVGLGYILLGLPALLHADSERISAWWLIVSYAFHALGTLCVVPICLAQVTLLAPAAWASVLIGVWYLSVAVGFALSGSVAQFALTAESGESTLSGYGIAFVAMAAASLVVAVGMKMVSGRVRVIEDRQRQVRSNSAEARSESGGIPVERSAVSS